MPRRAGLPSTELLTATREGAWRAAGTRVSLDSVVVSFWNGATPEEICQDYPSLSLAQVYALIGFYLANRDAVDTYLRRGDRADRALRRVLRSRHRQLLIDLRRRLQGHRRGGPRAA